MKTVISPPISNARSPHDCLMAMRVAVTTQLLTEQMPCFFLSCSVSSLISGRFAPDSVGARLSAGSQDCLFQLGRPVAMSITWIWLHRYVPLEPG